MQGDGTQKSELFRFYKHLAREKRRFDTLKIGNLFNSYAKSMEFISKNRQENIKKQFKIVFGIILPF